MNEQFGYAGTRAPTARQYVNYGYSASNLTTYDFGSFTIPANGLVVICVHGLAGSSRTLVSATIGGNAATVVVTSDSDPCTAIACLPVASGSRGVTVTFSGAMSDAAVFVWLITGYTSATATDSDKTNSAGASNLSLSTVTIPQKGVGIFAGAHLGSTQTTWTNATEAGDETPNGYFSTASAVVDATITATWSGSFACSIAGAAWR